MAITIGTAGIIATGATAGERGLSEIKQARDAGLYCLEVGAATTVTKNRHDR
jgi:hypothetical protein